MSDQPIPPNCEECNGHLIVREEYAGGVVYHLWTKGVGFWGFFLKSLEDARRTARAVTAPR